MTNNDRQEFAKKIIGLSEVFKDPLSEMSMEIYFEALSGFTIDEVSRGMSAVVRGRKFSGMPKPAEIIEAITGGKNVKALAAWDEVLKVAASGGPKGGTHEDEAIERGVRLCGGWHKLRMTEEKNIQFFKRDFIESYGVSDHAAFKPAIEAPKKIAKLVEKIG